MVINDEKIKQFIQFATSEGCFFCPLKYDNKNCKHYTAQSYEDMIYPCKKYLIEWLQK